MPNSSGATDSTTNGSQQMSWQEVLALIAGGFNVFVDGIGNIAGGDSSGGYTTTDGTTGTTNPNVPVVVRDEPVEPTYFGLKPMELGLALLVLLIVWKM